MSGGVDSSVVAALLAEQGHEVVGVMLRLWAEDWSEETPAGNRCCSVDAVHDARQVADRFGFPFYLVNAEAPFKQHVVDYFTAEYASGRTPNPCTACNQHIKFDFLLQRALALDASCLATGHYARIHSAEDRSKQLLRARDRSKDQSYMLYMLGQERLGRVLFPLGDLTKAEVRAEARRLGLPMAGKPDSQEICFVGRDYRDFLARHIPEAITPGELVDSRGQVVGRHQGLPLYTIGQRSRPSRTYVLGLQPESNRIIVGEESDLLRSTLRVRDAALNQPLPVGTLSARIRSHGREASCLVSSIGDYLEVSFDEPQRAVSPGQVIVFYDGDVVIGGGIID